MSRIRSKNTQPELVVRRYLHAQGLRYRLHVKDLPGSPDLVLVKYHCAIYVHGCFWHGHECGGPKALQLDKPYWAQKIQNNIKRDVLDQFHLVQSGWRMAVVWECTLRRKEQRQYSLQQLYQWIVQSQSDVLFLP